MNEHPRRQFVWWIHNDLVISGTVNAPVPDGYILNQLEGAFVQVCLHNVGLT